MKLMKKMIKSKFGLSTFRILGQPGPIAGVDDADRGTFISYRLKDSRKINSLSESGGSLSAFNEIEEIYVRSNEDAKDLIVNINGVVIIDIGTANKQYEVIRVSYDALSLDLNALIKIYSFTSGEKLIFVKDDKQKNKFLSILNSMNISSIDIIDLIGFESGCSATERPAI